VCHGVQSTLTYLPSLTISALRTRTLEPDGRAFVGVAIPSEGAVGRPITLALGQKDFLPRRCLAEVAADRLRRGV
jgi:hypothetical protein